jgi:hypothetical protein
VLADQHPHLTSDRALSVETVLAAAELVEEGVQQQLRSIGADASIDLRSGRKLWNAQWQAHTAVVAKTGSRKRAKDLQQRAAGEHEPLTVCVGYVLREFSTKVLLDNAPDLLGCYVPLGYGDGCGRVIVDSPEPRAPKRYCDRCAARAGRTLNAGLAKRALAKLRASRR